MGQAKLRGNFEERRKQALAAGRVKGVFKDIRYGASLTDIVDDILNAGFGKMLKYSPRAEVKGPEYVYRKKIFWGD